MTSTAFQLRDAFSSEGSRASRTVLFVDQAGSTSMKEKQPEATWLPSLGWLYDTATAIAMEEMPDVTVKYLGDGIMVVFDSDAATKAVTTAIRIQVAIKEANGTNGATGTIDFLCSAGIATGWVRAFTTPTGNPDYVGTVVDRARRLCDAANPQGIFIDRATGAAANMTRIESPVGAVFRRTAEQYQGDLQRAPLKGFDQPVEYYEIMWDHQLYGLKSGPLTESADRMRQSSQPPPIASSTVMPAGGVTSIRNAREEQRRGEVVRWVEDRGFGFVADALTGEEFYLARTALVYPEDLSGAEMIGTHLAFVAGGTATDGRLRRALAALVIGEYAEATLLNLPPEKPYGWLVLQDALGNRHRIYLRLPMGATYRVGDRLSFKVAANDRGTSADDVKRASEVADAA
jgi:class 3 adenylate cyclase